MNRLRASLPLILLILAGIALFASGMLDRFTPQQLVAHQSQIHAHIAAHPWLTRLVFIGLLTLTTCTGIRMIVPLARRSLRALPLFFERQSTLHELGQLTDRELADIGLNRSELNIVFEPAYANARSR